MSNDKQKTIATYKDPSVLTTEEIQGIILAQTYALNDFIDVTSSIIARDFEIKKTNIDRSIVWKLIVDLLNNQMRMTTAFSDIVSMLYEDDEAKRNNRDHS